MKKEIFEKLFNENTKDGVTNIEVIFGKVNDAINGAIKSTKETMPKLEDLTSQAIGKATEQVISGLGIENVKDVDGLKAYAKKLNATTDQTKETLLRVEGERDKFKTDFETLETTHNTMSTKFTGLQNESKISGSGYNMKYSNAIKAEANSRVTDDKDFAGALDDMKKDYPEWLVKGSGGGGDTGSGEHIDIDDAEVERWKKEAGVK
jgi:hypothetical protein